MLSRQELRKTAKARLRDAEVLTRWRRYDGAVYLCGYAVEMRLKARICQTLKWTGFPDTRKEFEGYNTFRTHDLDRLLHLSGVESKIKTVHLAEWSIVATWDPEVRYRPTGSASAQEARDLIDSVAVLMKVL